MSSIAFVSACSLEGHQGKACVFSLESAWGISARWNNSHRYVSGAARGLMKICVCEICSLTAPWSSLLPPTDVLSHPSFPSLFLPSLIWHCVTICCTAREHPPCPLSLSLSLSFFYARVHLKSSLLQIGGPYMGCMFVWCSTKINKPCVRLVSQDGDWRRNNKRGKERGSQRAEECDVGDRKECEEGSSRRLKNTG